MFKKTRRKIILSIMVALILLFGSTLSVIMVASYREIRQKNSDMLERYVDLYYLEQQSEGSEEKDTDSVTGQSSENRGAGSRPEQPPPEDGSGSPPEKPSGDVGPGAQREKPPLEKEPDYQLSTFYSVTLGEDDTVLAVDDGNKDVYSEEDLIRISREILNENRTSGKTDHLIYIVAQRPDYTLVAFMDNTVAEGSMSTLLRNFLIVGGAAIVVLLIISFIIASRIVRPLEESDRKQRQFISDASHELKTPVAVISTNAELLAREIGKNEWLANIRYENERMGVLIKQLLDLSRTENAEVPMEQVDFSRLVAGETLAFETLAFENGKEIQSEIEDGITLTGNRIQLTQLISVLLDNAIRHSTGAEIRVFLKRQGHHAVLNVVNEGDEIPREKMEHLFDRFYRVDEARNSDGQHYGLGLSIAKAVAEKHGGSIHVSCPEGKVLFAVSFPVKN
jgi:signal transduction histidine kinase